MNGGAHYRRSPDGIMEAQMFRIVQKDAIQGRKPEEPWKGRPFTNFGWGYFIPNKSYSVFLSKKEYLGEGTDTFNMKLMKFDR